MEKEIISEKEVSEDQHKIHNINILKFLLRLGLIVFLILLSFVAFYLLLKVDDKPSKKQNKIVTVSTQLSNEPSKPPRVRNQFETDKTQIATSLEVPPLYSGMEWIDTTEQSKHMGLNTASVYEELIDVPFKGHYWSSTSSLDYNEVEVYFYDKFDKLGWVGWGDNLEFNSFKLSGIIADGSCAGGRGTLGYKDGVVRLVAIQFSSKPCYPPGWPDNPTPFPSNMKFYTDYTVFISDPMPIEEIAKYVRPSSASRS